MIGARWRLLAGASCMLACTAAPTGERTEPLPPVTTADLTPTSDSDVEPEVAPAPEPGAGPSADADAVPESVYLVMDGFDLTMDIRVPPGGPPDGAGRPVVVLFHGASAATNDAEDVTAVADAAAAAGMVVFAPEWIAGDPFPLMFDDIEMLQQASECAVAFAQQEAPALGGDPARVITSGFSAGTGPALHAAVSTVGDEQTAGCRAAPRSSVVVGAVLGDGEYFWHSAAFDGAFGENPIGMQQATRLFVDPTNWRAGQPLRLRLWAAAEGTAPRALREPDAEGWIDDRDVDGSIRADLDAIGALVDDTVDYADSAALLERRADTAGVDVDLEIYPGGHTTTDKVDAIVDHLLAAAAAS